MSSLLAYFAPVLTVLAAGFLAFAVLALWSESRSRALKPFGTFVAAAIFLLFLAIHFQTSDFTARIVRLEAEITDRAWLFVKQGRDANAGETLESRIMNRMDTLEDRLTEALARLEQR